MLSGILTFFRTGEFGIQFWASMISAVLVVFFCLPVHEYAHGFIASKLGDPTAKNMGRLDLNPLAHLDPIGTVAIFLFGFGWARPVPINPNYFKNPKRGMALTALAGPVSNILMALIAMILYKLTAILGMTFSGAANILTIISYILFGLISLNLSLAVFNLVPIPPLDGSKILGAFLPDRIYNIVLQYERYAILLVYLVMFTGILSGPMNFILNALYRLLNFLTGFMDMFASFVR